MRNRDPHPRRRGAGATAVVTFDVAPNAEDLSNGLTHGLGLSLSEALNSGLPIFGIVNNALFEVIDDQNPANSPLAIQETLESFQVTSQNQPASAVQSWQVTNQNASDQPDNLVLVFQRPMPNDVLVNGTLEMFQYDLQEVSLDLDNGSDWLLIRVDVGPETWYYPAVRLGALANGASLPMPFETDITVQNPEIFERTGLEDVLGLPDWQLRAAYFVIPEPTTGGLVALGCAMLAWSARRRS